MNLPIPDEPQTPDDKQTRRSSHCYPSRHPFEYGMVMREVIHDVGESARSDTDNATVMVVRELKWLRTLLCWAWRQREAHINAAPSHYTAEQARAWVAGWDAAFDRFWHLHKVKNDLVDAVPSEDTKYG